MSSFRSKFALLALSAALFASAMHGQATQGEIDGAITDKTGAVIPGVSLTATNIDNGAVFTVTSNSAGLYTFPVLPIGTYKLIASKDLPYGVVHR